MGLLTTRAVGPTVESPTVERLIVPPARLLWN
jgi:hypothetical protein